MKIVKKIKILIKVILGKDILIKPEVNLNFQRYGSEYGCWDIAKDYVNEDSIIYSFGIGEDISFDLAIIKDYNVIVYGFDPTPKSIDWVKSQQLPDQFKMYEYGISDNDGVVKFNPPENSEHVSHTILERSESTKNAIQVPVKKLETIMSELGHDKLDILKMDIEGAEYCVIDYLLDSSIRPKQILVEFHHRFESVSIRQTKEAIRKLNSMGYKLFSVSERNEEYGFIHDY